MLTNYPKLTDTEIGPTLSRPLLVSAIEENTDRNGKAFVKVTLKDGFSDVTALMFATSAADLEARLIKPNTVVDADLAVSEYQGNKSYKVSNLAPAADKLLSVSDFVKLPPVDLDVMYHEIIELLNSAADNYKAAYTPLSDLAIRILTKYKDAYMTSSAAISMHHNLRGGLLYHSYRMVKVADAICNVYESLDRELLICGAALHDIGKIWEYDTSETGDAAFTASGIMFGHLYMGASLIKGFANVKDKAPYHAEKVQLLIHLILAHHGTQEWGTVACPAIPEALALHHIDNLDAKMYMFEEQYETLDAGELSDKKPFGLENRVYKPKYDPQICQEAGMAKLIFRYGAMGSSKTANALMVRYNYLEKGKNVVILKPACKNRDGEKVIRSRIGLEAECEYAEDFLDNYAGDVYDAIIVDEVQFMTPSDIDRLSDLVDENNITVICYGLRTDFQSNLFPSSRRLMEIADDIEQIKTICWCGKRAHFNARIVDGQMAIEGEQIQLGGNESYTALCRKHYKLAEIAEC